ncbi:hypothetical protein PsorP6_001514 [Peronosclerospora sorghi]|uniref:Uncharacterized protein n=1 Tax=Peronosclerospora sorghi TaxID=230839 RepID=A0ACC0WTS7_9STRA|nr:hypothetical protein PsorP6_001514 [Peronosclerospora sorghi]
MGPRLWQTTRAQIMSKTVVLEYKFVFALTIAQQRGRRVSLALSLIGYIVVEVPFCTQATSKGKIQYMGDV